MSRVELIDGTALPVHVGPGGLEPEGRGTPEFKPGLQGPSIIDKVEQGLQLDPHEQARLQAIVRVFDRSKKQERTYYDQRSGTTDPVTGNMVKHLYDTPQGWEAHVTTVTMCVPASTTSAPAINPAAPFAAANAFAFIAIVGSYGGGAANALTLLGSAVAFAPTSSGGPIIPGAWTFNDTNSPVAFGGEGIYLVIIGGSNAAILAQPININIRLNLYSQTA